jgi:polysaccharide deacetylase 2 family uncharacterized protein YibQ
MKYRKAGWSKGGNGKRWRRGTLMLCAFLAGLLTIGAVVLMPGGESKTNARFPPQRESPREHSAAAGDAKASPHDQVSLTVNPPIPRLAIVVYDCGYDPPRDAEWLKFPEKITLAIIPFGPSSRRLAESASARGFGVLIHIPMEPERSVSDRTEGFRLRRGMSRDEMDSLLGRMIRENSWASGVSNHMGSAFTADPESMAAFAALLKSRGLFLLDSMTTNRSVAVSAALKAGIPVARRDVSFDAGMSPEEMRRRWERAISIAKKKGKAVLLCPGRRESLQAMLDLVPDLGGEGIRAVTVDELLAGKRS